MQIFLRITLFVTWWVQSLLVSSDPISCWREMTKEICSSKNSLSYQHGPTTPIICDDNVSLEKVDSKIAVSTDIVDRKCGMGRLTEYRCFESDIIVRITQIVKPYFLKLFCFFLWIVWWILFNIVVTNLTVQKA